MVALDTSSRSSAWVILVDAKGALAGHREVAGGLLDRLLPRALADLLDGRPDAVVVLTGPGSYNGVRAGMAAALGLASACGAPLHGLGNLEAVAAAAGLERGEELVAVADAGRGGVYRARFAWSRSGPQVVGGVERVEAAAAGTGRTLATAAIPGVDAELVDPLLALTAAVPVALRRTPLAAAGLAATHASVQ